MYLAKSGSGTEYTVEVSEAGISVDGKLIGNTIQHLSGNRYQVLHDHKVFLIEVISSDQGKELQVRVNQKKISIELKDSLDLVMQKMGILGGNHAMQHDIKAPMPGMILEIMAQKGQKVKKDEALMVLEAMKMENVLKAPADVIIKSIHIKKGESVEKKQVLIEFEQ